jgi:transposase-like protein
MKERKRYSAAEKSEIVLEVLKEEKTLSQIASEHQIHPNLISRWRGEFIDGMPLVFTKESAKAEKERRENAQRLTELYTQVGRMTTQIEWLKKKSGITVLPC